MCITCVTAGMNKKAYLLRFPALAVHDQSLLSNLPSVGFQFYMQGQRVLKLFWLVFISQFPFQPQNLEVRLRNKFKTVFHLHARCVTEGVNM